MHLVSTSQTSEVQPTGFTVCGAQHAGSPVVLLHSSMSHKGQWRKLAQELATRHRVIAIDLYGYGDAPALVSRIGFSLGDEARRIETILRGIFGELPQFHLVGHSYGGAVALKLARNLPHWVSSLALYEPTAFHVLPEGDEGLIEIAEVACDMAIDIKRGAPYRAAEIFIDYWCGLGAFDAMPTHMQSLFATKVGKAVRDFGALINEPAKLADYAMLSAPVCLIAGRQSPQPSRCVASLLARTFSRGESHWIAAGHMAPVTAPELVNPLIARFLADSERYLGLRRYETSMREASVA